MIIKKGKKPVRLADDGRSLGASGTSCLIAVGLPRLAGLPRSLIVAVRAAFKHHWHPDMGPQ